MRIIEAIAVCVSAERRSGNLLAEFVLMGRSDLAIVEYSSWPEEYVEARAELVRRLEDGRFRMVGFKEGTVEVTCTPAEWAAGATLAPATDCATHPGGLTLYGVRIVTGDGVSEPLPIDKAGDGRRKLREFKPRQRDALIRECAERCVREGHTKQVAAWKAVFAKENIGYRQEFYQSFQATLSAKTAKETKAGRPRASINV